MCQPRHWIPSFALSLFRALCVAAASFSFPLLTGGSAHIVLESFVGCFFCSFLAEAGRDSRVTLWVRFEPWCSHDSCRSRREGADQKQDESHDEVDVVCCLWNVSSDLGRETSEIRIQLAIPRKQYGQRRPSLLSLSHLSSPVQSLRSPLLIRPREERGLRDAGLWDPRARFHVSSLSGPSAGLSSDSVQADRVGDEAHTPSRATDGVLYSQSSRQRARREGGEGIANLRREQPC